jgi:hypothetical protein
LIICVADDEGTVDEDEEDEDEEEMEEGEEDEEPDEDDDEDELGTRSDEQSNEDQGGDYNDYNNYGGYRTGHARGAESTDLVDEFFAWSEDLGVREHRDCHGGMHYDYGYRLSYIRYLPSFYLVPLPLTMTMRYNDEHFILRYSELLGINGTYVNNSEKSNFVCSEGMQYSGRYWSNDADLHYFKCYKQVFGVLTKQALIYEQLKKWVTGRAETGAVVEASDSPTKQDTVTAATASVEVNSQAVPASRSNDTTASVTEIALVDHANDLIQCFLAVQSNPDYLKHHNIDMFTRRFLRTVVVSIENYCTLCAETEEEAQLRYLRLVLQLFTQSDNYVHSNFSCAQLVESEKTITTQPPLALIGVVYVLETLGRLVICNKRPSIVNTMATTVTTSAYKHPVSMFSAMVELLGLPYVHADMRISEMVLDWCKVLCEGFLAEFLGRQEEYLKEVKRRIHEQKKNSKDKKQKKNEGNDKELPNIEFLLPTLSSAAINLLIRVTQQDCSSQASSSCSKPFALCPLNYAYAKEILLFYSHKLDTWSEIMNQLRVVIVELLHEAEQQTLGLSPIEAVQYLSESSFVHKLAKAMRMASACTETVRKVISSASKQAQAQQQSQQKQAASQLQVQTNTALLEKIEGSEQIIVDTYARTVAPITVTTLSKRVLVELERSTNEHTRVNQATNVVGNNELIPYFESFVSAVCTCVYRSYTANNRINSLALPASSRSPRDVTSASLLSSRLRAASFENLNVTVLQQPTLQAQLQQSSLLMHPAVDPSARSTLEGAGGISDTEQLGSAEPAVLASPPMLLKREFSVPDSRFQSQTMKKMSLLARQLSLNDVDLNDLASELNPGRSSIVSPTTAALLSTPPSASHSSHVNANTSRLQTPPEGYDDAEMSKPVTMLIRFVSSGKHLLNAMLRRRVQLLDSSLMLLRIIPECRQTIEFDVKRMFLSFKIKEWKAEVARSPQDRHRNGRRRRRGGDGNDEENNEFSIQNIGEGTLCRFSVLRPFADIEYPSDVPDVKPPASDTDDSKAVDTDKAVDTSVGISEEAKTSSEEEKDKDKDKDRDNDDENDEEGTEDDDDEEEDDEDMYDNYDYGDEDDEDEDEDEYGADDEDAIFLEINRDNIMADTFEGLKDITPRSLLLKPFEVTFNNEEGIDAGGLTREWLMLVMREFFKPEVALFTPSSDGTTFQPSPNSSANPEHL